MIKGGTAMKRLIQTGRSLPHPWSCVLRICLILPVISLSLSCFAWGETASAAESLNIQAKSCVLVDAGSGTVLYEENSHEKLPPASVTKIMTMLLICEAVDAGKVTLDDTVTVSEYAAGMGGSQMYMEPGEQHTLNELLTGISMVSANDACVAAAEYISGSVPIFVEQMNKKARELGMEDTNFVNTNGLPVAGHVTSAYDIGVMASALLSHDMILPYLSNLSAQITVGKNQDHQKALEMVNTNKLLRSYSGAIGIKTGFTQDAGYCLAGSAEREGLRLISVVLGCESSKIRFAEAARLLDYGFANYESVEIASKGQILGCATVEKGMQSYVELRSDQDIRLLVPKGHGQEVSYEIQPADNLTAPVKEGQEAGTLTVRRGEEPVETYRLSADTAIRNADFKTLIVRSIEAMMKG